MSSLEKKKLSSTTSNPSLPNDLLLSCLARVSRLYYWTLSLVSKKYPSLIASPELYKVRSLLGRTEKCLYVCIDSDSDRNPRWFTLSREPDKTLTGKKKSSGYVLAKVPMPYSPPVNDRGHGLVAVGSSIYNIGGSRSSSSVSVLDCTSHTWSEAPSFRVKLRSFSACVIDRKIYVVGCYKDFDSHYCMKESIEVLDTKTQIWNPLPNPCSMRKYSLYSKSACIDGMLRLEIGKEAFAYNSKEGRWDLDGTDMFGNMYSKCYCAIENVLYSISFGGTFRWYDTKASMWRDLMGLVGLPEIPDIDMGRVRLADYGGKMAVFWDEVLPHSGGHQTMIWCAEIALKRRNDCEIWGEVEWFDIVLTVPGKCNVVKVLAATV